MSVTARIAPAITITGATLLVGCHGSGGSCGSFGSYGSSYGSCGYLFPGPDGIYEGSLTSAGSPQPTPVVAIIADNGQGRIAAADGRYYRLNVAAAGNVVNGSYGADVQGGASPADPAIPPTSGSASGLITSAGLNLTLTDTLNAQQSLTLTFDNVYNRRSSLAALAGSWIATASGLTLTATIQPDGSFSGSDANNCTYTGTFSLIDPTFDIYAETHVRSCNGVTVTFTGLAALLPTNAASGPTTELKLLTDNDAGEYLVADLQQPT